MEDKVIVAVIIVAAISAFLFIIPFGNVPNYDITDDGRSVEITGEVSSKWSGGSSVTIEGGGNSILADVIGSSQSYVADDVETGDCVTVEGTLDVDNDGYATIEYATVS